MKIKDIARTAPIGEKGFKIIFLDEADNLTSDAQAALRRTMENYTRTARFILSANYSSRIIEPIQSRTAVFRFRPVKPDAIRTVLDRIAKAEKLKVTKEGMDALVYIAQGDLRKAVNALQAACPQTRLISVGDREGDVYDLFVLARAPGVEISKRRGSPSFDFMVCLVGSGLRHA